MITAERKNDRSRNFFQALGLALAVHLGVVIVMIIGTWDWQPFDRSAPPVMVTLVDQAPGARAREEEAARQAAADRQQQEQRQRDEQARQERERQQQEQERQEREQEEQARREVERQRRERELAEQRAEQAERDRLAELRRQREAEQERLEAQRREEEQARMRELAELRAQREQAQREREEQERRLEELARQRADEEAERQAAEEADRLRLGPLNKRPPMPVARPWLKNMWQPSRSWCGATGTRPPTANPGVLCRVRVVQIPGGEIIAAEIVRPCNADDATRRSITAAVLRVGFLPYQGYETVFAREIDFDFRYDG